MQRLYNECVNAGQLSKEEMQPANNINAVINLRQDFIRQINPVISNGFHF